MKLGKNKFLWYIFLIALPALAIFFSLFIGRYTMNGTEVVSTLLHPALALPSERSVVWLLRLPRALAAAFVGASLAVSGAAFQGVFRNPLVNSGLLGVSNGAGFGAALAIVSFGAGISVYFFSFAFAVLAVLLSYMAGRIYGTTPNVTLILGGVIVSSFFSALTSIMKFMADTYSQLPAITFWLMGSFASVNYTHFIAFIPMAAGIVVIFLCRWKINVLSMGDKEAAALGVNLSLYKGLIICGGNALHRRRGLHQRRNRLDRAGDPAYQQDAGGQQQRETDPAEHLAGRDVFDSDRSAGQIGLHLGNPDRNPDRHRRHAVFCLSAQENEGGRMALNVLEIKGLSFSYGEQAVFADLDLSVQNGEVVCLMGPNGCGENDADRLHHGDREAAKRGDPVDGQAASTLSPPRGRAANRLCAAKP